MDTTSPNAPAPRRVNFWLKLKPWQKLLFKLFVEIPLVLGTIFGSIILIILYTPTLQHLLFNRNETQLLLTPDSPSTAIFPGIVIGFGMVFTTSFLFVRFIAIFSPGFAEDLEYLGAGELKSIIKNRMDLIKTHINAGIYKIQTGVQEVPLPTRAEAIAFTEERDRNIQQRDPTLLQWIRKKTSNDSNGFLLLE